MPPGRKPKPIEIKRLEGNPGKRPLPEPIKANKGGLTCPQHLSSTARTEWRRIVPELEAMGLLANVDRAALAAYCQAWGRWVEAERILREKGLLYKTQKGNVITSPYLWIVNKALAQMHQFLTEFGLTPSSRARLAVPGAKQPKGEMEKFLEQAEQKF